MQKNPEFEPQFKYSTTANITLYNVGNPYVTPCDGYIFAQSLLANELIDIYILTPDGSQVAQIRYTTPYNYQYHSYFVPMGMKLYATANQGSPVYFNGIREY